MKRRFAGSIAIILTLFVFPYAYANLGTKQIETPDDPNSPAYSIHLNKVPKTNSSDNREVIQIRYNNMPLKSVLQNISDETGVVFNVANVLLEKEVNADITSDNWESAVDTLLAKYSRVEVWTANIDTSRVWLLESGDAKSAKPKENSKSRTAEKQPVVDKNAPGPGAPIANAFGGGVENLPPHILMEPSVIAYLETAGVEIPASVRKMSPPLPKGVQAGKIPAYILSDPQFMGFLGAKGLPRPVG